jgi:hypothetical protein
MRVSDYRRAAQKLRGQPVKPAAVRDTGKKAAKEKAVRLTTIAATTTEIISRRCLDTSFCT